MIRDRKLTEAKPGRTAFASPTSAKLPRVVGIAIVLSVGAGLLALSRRDGAQQTPSIQTKTTTTATTSQGKTGAGEDLSSPPAERRPLSFYTGVVRGSMFNAPEPPAPKKVVVAVAPKVKKAPKPATPKYVPPVLPPINPFADWSYTGTVHLADKTMALLENTKTGEGQYVSSGDTFLGAQVQDITDQQVSLSSGGKPSLLAKSDNFTVKQLDAPAPTAAPATQPGQPQAGQQAAQTAVNVPVQVNGPTVTLPNGRVLSGDRAQRRMRWMNQNFNR